jgi:hypothetical protein
VQGGLRKCWRVLTKRREMSHKSNPFSLLPHHVTSLLLRIHFTFLAPTAAWYSGLRWDY